MDGQREKDRLNAAIVPFCSIHSNEHLNEHLNEHSNGALVITSLENLDWNLERSSSVLDDVKRLSAKEVAPDNSDCLNNYSRLC